MFEYRLHHNSNYQVASTSSCPYAQDMVWVGPWCRFSKRAGSRGSSCIATTTGTFRSQIDIPNDVVLRSAALGLTVRALLVLRLKVRQGNGPPGLVPHCQPYRLVGVLRLNEYRLDVHGIDCERTMWIQVKYNDSSVALGDAMPDFRLWYSEGTSTSIQASKLHAGAEG